MTDETSIRSNCPVTSSIVPISKRLWSLQRRERPLATPIISSEVSTKTPAAMRGPTGVFNRRVVLRPVPHPTSRRREFDFRKGSPAAAKR